MGIKKGSKIGSDHKKWKRIFNALVQMLQNQQSQLETFVKERRLVGDRFEMVNQQWASDVSILEDQICEMKDQLMVQEMAYSFDLAKSDFERSLQQSNACLCKLKLECTDEELADIKACFDYLSQKCSDVEDNSRQNIVETDKKESGRDSNMKSVTKSEEVRRLKLEYEKLNSEVSALLAEKKFIWNQYNLMENKYNTTLEKKNAEIDQANEKIVKLLLRMEELQSSNCEKDNAITRLNDKVNTMEADKNKWNGEISRLSQELDLLRNSKSASVTPVLSRCTTGARITSTIGGKTSNRDLLRKSKSASVTPVMSRSTSGGKTSNRGGSIISGKKESSVAQVTNPNPMKDMKKAADTIQAFKHRNNENSGGRSLKRKFESTPKLFSANFKVPRLKHYNSSSKVQGSHLSF